jgi:hypothetical protein
MPVVPPELGVGSLERGVSVRFGLLDTVAKLASQPAVVQSSAMRSNKLVAAENRGCVPVPVVLLRLIMLRRVLGF